MRNKWTRLACVIGLCLTLSPYMSGCSGSAKTTQPEATSTADPVTDYMTEPPKKADDAADKANDATQKTQDAIDAAGQE